MDRAERKEQSGEFLNGKQSCSALSLCPGQLIWYQQLDSFSAISLCISVQEVITACRLMVLPFPKPPMLCSKMISFNRRHSKRLVLNFWLDKQGGIL